MRTEEGGQRGRGAAGQWLRSWRNFLSRVRQVAGMPDYGAYLQHIRVHHPETAAVSEREYFDGFVRARSGGLTRCC